MGIVGLDYKFSEYRHQLEVSYAVSAWWIENLTNILALLIVVVKSVVSWRWWSMIKSTGQKLLLQYIDYNKTHKIKFECLCADSTIPAGCNQKFVSLHSVLCRSPLCNLVKFHLAASKRRKACKATNNLWYVHFMNFVQRLCEVPSGQRQCED